MCVHVCGCVFVGNRRRREGKKKITECPFYFFKTELAMLNMKIKNQEKLSAGFPLINNNNGNGNHSGVTANTSHTLLLLF